ncbi:flavin reductase [Ochrovirga pacifica]|uniref:flavin reductase n=1 Tax=Ochrovirga pacifica TaxID=1042376 RepID=UPI000255A2C4|nr:flavin reductase [Ochrovirga pacifica]
MKDLKGIKKKVLNFYNNPNTYKVSLIFLLLIAIAIQGGKDFTFFNNKLKTEPSVELSHIKDIFPLAHSFSVKNKKGFQFVFSSKNDTIGKVISSFAYAKNIKGFAGYVPVLIGIDKNNIIKGTTLLKHHESQEYMEYIIDDKLLYKWNANTIEQAYQTKVDAITAATETSHAIIQGVNNTLSYLTENASLGQALSLKEIIQYILTLVTILFALLVCYVKSLKQYRTYMLIAVALVMGFLYKTMLSVALLYGWLVNGLPWNNSPVIILLLLLCIVLPFTTKKQFYCHYMCPYGAVQELAGKISPIKKKKSLKWLKWKGIEIQTILFTLLLVGLLIGFFPELSFIEPFTSFSYEIVSWAMIVFGVIFIILSFFYSKPWCRICPTGFIFDSCKKQTKSSDKIILLNMKKSEIMNLLLILVIIILLLKIDPKTTDKLDHHNTNPEKIVQPKDSITSTEKKSIGKRPTMFPLPAVVIGSYSKDGTPNIMTASWSGIVNSSPLSMSVSLREATQTYKNVMESKAFTLNYASEDLLPYVDWVGEHSGKDYNKFKTLNLTPIKSSIVNAPYVKEFPVVVELKVIKIEKLGRHTQFIGEVIDTKVNEGLLIGNKKNKVDIKKMKPIIVGSGGGYFGFGEWLGQPGKVNKVLGIELEQK